MLTTEQKKYLDLILDEPYKIGHWLGFKDLTSLHNDWIKIFVQSKKDETLLAHRGSFKTTCLSIAISLLMILYPNKNIIFLRKTDDDITEIINQVKKFLDSDVLKLFVKKIYGIELVITKSNSSEITTNLMTVNKGTPQLLGIGIKGSLTGKHADIVITDDIVNLKDRISKAERDFTKSVYMELQNIKNKGGRILNTGTTWHKDDAIGLMPNKQVYDCYTTELITKEIIQQLRDSMTSSLFAANYELKHIADADAMFTNPKYTDKIESIYNGICHIDARYSGKDHTAFTIIKKVGDNFYVYGKMFNKHIDDCLDEILQLKNMYKGGSINVEDNGDKGYLAKEIRRKSAIANIYHENMNKYIKISSYLKRYWKDIVFLDATDQDYVNEILDYTEDAEHDDCPDSLASIIRKLVGNTLEIGYSSII